MRSRRPDFLWRSTVNSSGSKESGFGLLFRFATASLCRISFKPFSEMRHLPRSFPRGSPVDRSSRMYFDFPPVGMVISTPFAIGKQDA